VPLAATLKYLKARGIKTAVAGPITVYDVPLPILLARAPRNQDQAFLAAHRVADRPVLDREFAKIAGDGSAAYVSIYRRLCQASDCRTLAAPGVPMQVDGSHLSAPGSEVVASAFEPVIAN